MPQPLLNSFTSFKLSPEEELASRSFHSLNQIFLQNLRGNIAQDLLNLELDTDKPRKYFMDQAFLQGQLKILTYILEVASSPKLEESNPSPPSP